MIRLAPSLLVVALLMLPACGTYGPPERHAPVGRTPAPPALLPSTPAPAPTEAPGPESPEEKREDDS